MHIKQLIIATMLASSLAACGGGTGSASTPTADNSQAITQAMDNIAASTPEPKPAFSGAFVKVEDEGMGYVSGTSHTDVVRKVVAPVVADPSKYAPLYKLMLSDQGLKVAIVGEQVGKSQITGLPLYAPDVVYWAKLGKDGNVSVGQ